MVILLIVGLVVGYGVGFGIHYSALEKLRKKDAKLNLALANASLWISKKGVVVNGKGLPVTAGDLQVLEMRLPKESEPDYIFGDMESPPPSPNY